MNTPDLDRLNAIIRGTLGGKTVAELSREPLTGAGRSGEPSPKGCDTASHGPLRSGPTLSFPCDDLGNPVDA